MTFFREVLSVTLRPRPSIAIAPVLMLPRKILASHKVFALRALERVAVADSPKTTTMKFSTVSVLIVAARASGASAWTTHSLPRARYLVASQLHSTATTSPTTVVEGKEETESFRLQFKEDGNPVSPWHDIPLKNDDGSYNMVRADR